MHDATDTSASRLASSATPPRDPSWNAVAARPEFDAMVAAKKRFVVPATAFFVIYYFALLVLVGFAPNLMDRPVLGVNAAYLFALSQFFMAWIIAALYVRAAARFDRMAADVLRNAAAGDRSRAD